MTSSPALIWDWCSAMISAFVPLTTVIHLLEPINLAQACSNWITVFDLDQTPLRITSNRIFSSFSASQIGHLIHWPGFMVFSPPKINGLLDFFEMIEKFDFDKIPAFKLRIDAFFIKSLLLAFFILIFSFI